MLYQFPLSSFRPCEHKQNKIFFTPILILHLRDQYRYKLWGSFKEAFDFD